jgi:hypothetical protein
VLRGDQRLGEWARSYRDVKVDGILSAKDPVPGAIYVGRQLRSVVRARLQKGAPAR